MKLILGVLLVLGYMDTVSTSRILMIPYDHGSHVNFFSVLGVALKEKGHDISVFVTPPFEKLVTKQGLKSIVTRSSSTVDADALMNVLFSNRFTNPFSLFMNISMRAVDHIREVFSEKELFEKLTAAKFDLAIVDGIDFHRAKYLIAYSLGVPYITLTARHDPWNSGLPTNAALEAAQINALVGHTNVFQRLLNVLVTLAMYKLAPPSPISYITDDLITELVPHRPNIGFKQIYKNSEMFLVNIDIICLDFHRVSAPHYQIIGGLGMTNAKPLPKELEEFVSASKEGFILVTFGSLLKNIEKNVLRKMLEVFADLKQNVIIRHEGEVPETVPKNVRLESWLPQNDILGHPNTKLFVTHSGNNGQLEAVHHGVPMLMMPFFGDQKNNARRGEIHKFGLEINPNDFTVDELRTKVNELLDNPLYRETIKNCSTILKSLPKAQDTAVFWVEHVLRFGGAHLKPYYMDHPLYEYLMIDVYVLVLVFAIIFYYIIKRCCRMCCGCCKTKKAKAKSD